jgi:hypothetical protein
MSSRLISDRVKALVGEHIVSVEQLEVLLLLRRHPGLEWTPAQVNDQLRSSIGSVAERLADLESRRFLRHEAGRYQYESANSHDAAVAELADAFAERRFSIIELIYSMAAGENSRRRPWR